METVVFCSFAANETDREFRVNTMSLEIKRVYLARVAFTGMPDAGQPVVLLQTDGNAMAVATEGLSGYPVPLTPTLLGVGNLRAGSETFSPPIFIAEPNRSSYTSIRLVIRNVDGTPPVHTGMHFWIVLRGPEHTWDGEAQKRMMWTERGYASNEHDWRWDYTPSQAAQAAAVASQQAHVFYDLERRRK